MEEKQTPPAENDDANSLEGGSLEGGEEIIDATSDTGSNPLAIKSDKPAPLPRNDKGIKGLLKKFNIYLLVIVFIFIIAGVILAIAYFQNKKASTTSTLETQTLTQQALDQVANSDANIGNTQQILNVLSSAVFAGKVLIRQDAEIAGNLQVGGTLGISNISVAGTGQFNQAQISKNLSVGGDLAVQGAGSFGKSLQVKGGGNFSGPVSAPQITTTDFNLNGDLIITRHIVIGGGTPSRTNGPALGGGGSSSISGSDTAGTVSINVGSSPTSGCFMTVNFTRKFSSTPRVVITPVGPSGGAIDYYVLRSSTSFSICDSTTPPAGTSFSFDYFVVN